MTRTVMRRPGLTGARRDLHRVGQGVDRPISQRLVEPAEPTPQSAFSHEGPSPIGAAAPAQCNHDLSSSPNCSRSPARSRPTVSGAAARHGHPALRGAQAVRRDRARRTAGQSAVLHVRLRGRGAGRPARCCWRRAPGASVRWRRWRCSWRCFPPTSTWSGCGRTSRCSCGSARSPGCRCRSR